MNPNLRRLIGLRAVDKVAKHLNAEPPRKVKMPPPITDREWSVDALQDRVHPTSGRLIRSTPVKRPAPARADDDDTQPQGRKNGGGH